MNDWIKRLYAPCEEGCCCHDHHHDEEEGDFDEDMMIEIVDPETNEKFEFFFADQFEYQDQDYCVLVTDEEEPQYVIAKLVEGEDGDSYVETLDDECDDIYEAYEKILEEEFEEEGEEEK